MDYTMKDFLETDEPYKYLYRLKKSDPFRYEQALVAVKNNARTVGVRDFNRLYAGYVNRERPDRGNI
jgi:hypothetical protein